MALPLYLAMTRREMEAADTLPPRFAWMACRFLPEGPGLCGIPDVLPPGTVLILEDRFPCRDHDPERIAAELAEAAARLQCESVLLDFERNPDAHTKKVADALFQALPCPVAAPPGFVEDPACAIFLPPCPLHVPLAEYLHPWQSREIWLDVTMQQQTITVTRDGTTYSPTAPTDRQAGGWFDSVLQCQCISEISEEAVRFTLFDTPETFARKLDHAAALGVSRAVGLYQELNAKL